MNAEFASDYAGLYASKPTTTNGDEMDAVHAADVFDWNAGTRKRAKRSMNRRSRHNARQILAQFAY